LFLAISVSGVVAILSLVSQVKYATLIYRSLVVFFAFGILGALLGTIFEIFLMPPATNIQREKVKEEVKLDDERIERDLGDMLSTNRPMVDIAGKNVEPSKEFKPAVFPKMSVEGGKVVSRGDSAIVS